MKPVARLDRRDLAVVVGAVVVALAAFAWQAARHRAWLVDDAGISMAYAWNLVDGHGLVAQPGAEPVEGFSNPLWVFSFAALNLLGVFDRGELLGFPDYVLVPKLLAAALHLVVLAATWIVLRQLLAPLLAPRLSKRHTMIATIAAWTACALLLAFNPSYVVWVVSGLENPLYAAVVTVLAAVLVAATAHGRLATRTVAVNVGLLAAAAALTRPDGAIYTATLLLLLADQSRTRAERWRAVATGAACFATAFGAYLVFRIAYYGALLPNTATAKNQRVPDLKDLLRVDELVHAFGWPLVATAALGLAAAVVAGRSADDPSVHLVPQPALLLAAVLSLALLAYAVLPPDWMDEYRFATPVWPLLSVATVAGAVALLTLAGSRAAVATVAALLLVAGLAVAPVWLRRADAFSERPTITLCRVADRFGTFYNVAADSLGLDADSASVLLPDLGGTLLVSRLHVIDLAGLSDVRIADYLANGDATGLADHVLTELRPTFVHVHDYWVEVSGLHADPRFAVDYVALLGDTDFVRRDAVDPARLDTARADLVELDAAARAGLGSSPGAACGALLSTN